MHCSNCFHRDICGDSSPYKDATACKQYIKLGDVLCGPALEVVMKDYDDLREHVKKLETKLNSYKHQFEDLEREVKLLRIIKQTLEMQSGMEFDF